MVGVIVIFVVLLVLGVPLLYAKLYRKVDQGRALIVNKMSKVEVYFTGGLVIPVVHRAEVMDISVKTIEIARTGKEGLICKDNIRADIKVTFFVRVNKTAEDVLKVAQAIGTNRASHQETLEELFNAKFSEALKTVGKVLDFEELYTRRHDFKEQILEVIGEDLNGYVLDDAAIDYLEQTPMTNLDPKNVLDARGIRKITEITAEQAVKTNSIQREEQKAIRKQDVEAREAILELDRQQADAEAKQNREIASVQAREQAETMKVQAEERKKAELARIKLEEEVAINEENKMRQIEVAQKNRERVVAVEQERVLKDQHLEMISREREVELKRIAKEKALEVEKKEIADVIRSRVAVDKTVAEEEERIKDLRVVAAAKRAKDAKVIEAEAEAQEKLVKDIKRAEAQEQAAKHLAKEKLTMAEAALEASEKEARAKIRLAEGTQAEAAAPGLAEVKVKEAEAIAIEKQGDARARVTLGQMKAEAEGKESQGLAEVRIKEAEAEAIAKQGRAQAEAKRELMLAEAVGTEQQGLAKVKVKDADAAATEKMGQAKAVEIREKLLAEAQGLEQKAEAMKKLDQKSREHEEYRLRIEKMVEVEMAALGVRRDVAQAQAQVLGAAMGSAKINIVGGDGQFFDQFIRAVSLGQALDGVVHNSDTAKQLMSGYLSGEQSLTQDIKDVLSRPSLDSESIKNLSVSAALTKVMGQLGEGERGKVATLLQRAKELGLT
ncbi:MAG: hypothetical protein H6712_12190 [Myxococcales bacterium]|nr:hypothetical protein [Myxococcales bacterium]MCB9714616.1 hypothetical protein [Myxococcales bacterium]